MVARGEHGRYVEVVADQHEVDEWEVPEHAQPHHSVCSADQFVFEHTFDDGQCDVDGEQHGVQHDEHHQSAAQHEHEHETGQSVAGVRGQGCVGGE